MSVLSRSATSRQTRPSRTVPAPRAPGDAAVAVTPREPSPASATTGSQRRVAVAVAGGAVVVAAVAGGTMALLNGDERPLAPASTYVPSWTDLQRDAALERRTKDADRASEALRDAARARTFGTQ